MEAAGAAFRAVTQGGSAVMRSVLPTAVGQKLKAAKYAHLSVDKPSAVNYGGDYVLYLEHLSLYEDIVLARREKQLDERRARVVHQKKSSYAQKLDSLVEKKLVPEFVPTILKKGQGLSPELTKRVAEASVKAKALKKTSLTEEQKARRRAHNKARKLRKAAREANLKATARVVKKPLKVVKSEERVTNRLRKTYAQAVKAGLPIEEVPQDLRTKKPRLNKRERAEEANKRFFQKAAKSRVARRFKG